jgi:molybdopterin synthase catalytic subunit
MLRLPNQTLLFLSLCNKSFWGIFTDEGGGHAVQSAAYTHNNKMTHALGIKGVAKAENEDQGGRLFDTHKKQTVPVP